MNCADSSDEYNCTVTCSANEFKCPNENFCIRNSFLCDGDLDCANGADELNCTCPSDHFQCSNGHCILNRWRCDGWNDCVDNSDESKELCSTQPCEQNAFRCANKRCMHKSVRCNGVDECGDNSDEQKCEKIFKCNADQFQCETDQVCILKEFQCDGEPQCNDFSDEINCNSSVCGFGDCSQICLEKKAGRYSCRCSEGYTKREEKNDTCRATGQDPLLLVASDSELRYLFPQKHESTLVHGVLSESQNKIDVLDVLFLPDNVVLFWIDHHNKLVQKIFMKSISGDSSKSSKFIMNERTVIVSIVFLG